MPEPLSALLLPFLSHARLLGSCHAAIRVRTAGGLFCFLFIYFSCALSVGARSPDAPQTGASTRVWPHALEHLGLASLTLSDMRRACCFSCLPGTPGRAPPCRYTSRPTTTPLSRASSLRCAPCADANLSRGHTFGTSASVVLRARGVAGYCGVGLCVFQKAAGWVARGHDVHQLELLATCQASRPARRTCASHGGAAKSAFAAG